MDWANWHLAGKNNQTSTLTQCKMPRPIFVAGADVNTLAGIEQFQFGALRLPGTCRGLTCRSKEALQRVCRGLCPGELTRAPGPSSRSKRARDETCAVRGTTGQKETGKSPPVCPASTFTICICVEVILCPSMV